MALVLKGSYIGRLLNVTLNQSSTLSCSGRCVFLPPIFAVQTANICGKALRDKNWKRPPPYPYETKRYGFLNSLFDKTSWRFNENSKIIVVEGPIGAGKTCFAEALAEDLDMLHMPECNLEMMYINEYGFDLRTLDPQLPEACRSFDVKDFYENPNHSKVALLQINMYKLRYFQYLDALLHLFSTGQGVILERCAYSDFVFLETMHKLGYISKGARSVYYDIVQNTLRELMRPHLIIYLDIPVAKVQERIKERNIPHEVNTKVLSSEYLKTLEEFYKQRYLTEMSSHSELLVYDWSDFGDVEVVVEDVERIDFDQYDSYDLKLKDWRFDRERDWCATRAKYSVGRAELMELIAVPRVDVPELLISGDDKFHFNKVLSKAPGEKYSPGFNADMGDTGILFKLRHRP